MWLKPAYKGTHNPRPTRRPGTHAGDPPFLRADVHGISRGDRQRCTPGNPSRRASDGVSPRGDAVRAVRGPAVVIRSPGSLGRRRHTPSHSAAATHARRPFRRRRSRPVPPRRRPPEPDGRLPAPIKDAGSTPRETRTRRSAARATRPFLDANGRAVISSACTSAATASAGALVCAHSRRARSATRATASASARGRPRPASSAAAARECMRASACRGTVRHTCRRLSSSTFRRTAAAAIASARPDRMSSRLEPLPSRAAEAAAPRSSDSPARSGVLRRDPPLPRRALSGNPPSRRQASIPSRAAAKAEGTASSAAAAANASDGSATGADYPRLDSLPADGRDTARPALTELRWSRRGVRPRPARVSGGRGALAHRS